MTMEETRLADYRPFPWRIDTVVLHVSLDPDATDVHARLAVEAAPGGQPLKLDGDSLSLDMVAIDDVPLAASAYHHDETGLVIHEPPRRFTLETRTTIAPARNVALEGLYTSSDIYCTQCEAEGFRRITFFPDRPDVLATYTVAIDADRGSCPVLLSNGNLVKEHDLAEGRHRTVWHDPFPKPSYLFALVAGDLGCLEDTFTTASGRDVSLRIWSEHGNREKCLYAMDSLKRAMRWDEVNYGLEYDLDTFNIVAVADFNAGAMENKSLNIFNSSLVLASPQTATDGNYEAIESVIAHEYFHNWTGDRVTCRDWFQLSLKEGLTVYRDQEFTADMRSRPVKRIDDVRRLRAAQFPEDAGPMAHPVRPSSYVEINNFYTPTVYEKGAEVIRMMERILGRDGFRRGMDLYIERHDGMAVTCDDFIAAMADANGVDLGHFSLWYSQAGTPEVTASGQWLADEAAYELVLEQQTPPTPGQASKDALHIPLEVGLVGPNGNDMEATLEGRSATSHVLDLDRPSRTFRFEGVGARPVLSLNRDFTAPVRVTSDIDDAGLAFLMAHDSDPFARWEAGQSYATRLLLAMVATIRQGDAPATDERWLEAMSTTIGDTSLDPAFKARALALPSESWLAEQMETVDVEAIHEARNSMKMAAADRFPDGWRAMIEGDDEPYSPDGEQAGRRALKGVALSYCAAPGDAEAVALVTGAYAGAGNMTDRLAALSLIAAIDTPRRDECLADFRDRFRDDDLVMDKWLGVQAASPLDDTLARVRDLLAHEVFSLEKPNKVFALIGGFAMANPLNFHRQDGSGYSFVADRLMELDDINPQVAARIINPLIRWRRQDSDRQALMRHELERIRSKENLSPDLGEKITKSLEQED